MFNDQAPEYEHTCRDEGIQWTLEEKHMLLFSSISCWYCLKVRVKDVAAVRSAGNVR